MPCSRLVRPDCRGFCYARFAMRINRLLALLVLLMASATPIVRSFAPAKPPLAPADLDTIAALLKLEDTRQFDGPTLTAALKSSHAEVRRRAALAIGRIANASGKPLLLEARTDKDVEVVATVAFAYGQLK